MRGTLGPDDLLKGAVFRICGDGVSGTAFLVGEGWHLLTARHVVVGVSGPRGNLHILLDNAIPRTVEVCKDFPEQDVALLRLSERLATHPLDLARRLPQPGEEFRAGGYPSNFRDFWYQGRFKGGSHGLFEVDLQQPYKEQLNGLSGAPVFDASNLVVGVFLQHDVYQPNFGKVAALQAFYDSLDFSSPRDDALNCFVVLSESEGTSSAILESAVSEATEILQKQRREPIISSYCAAADLVASRNAYNTAVQNLCRSEIAVFDVTEFTPAVMLLLGIRSVVRRGVTIASLAAADNWDELPASPFNLKDVNFVQHSDEKIDGKWSRDIFKERILSGLELSRAEQYLDLPTFDAVRSLPPGERGKILRTEKILVLCPYSPAYSNKNWKRVLNGLEFVLESSQPEATKPTISRVLDLNNSSPRLVSQMIYQAIRRIEMCVVDWTAWRANVFFEMGVRLAVNRDGAVSIIDHRAFKAATQKNLPEAVLAQRRHLLDLFKPIRYESTSSEKAPFREVLDRFERREEDGELNLAASHTYNLVADAIDLKVETASMPVQSQLNQEANLLSSDDSEGTSALLYPKNQKLLEIVEKGVTERLWAAWHYLNHPYKLEEIQGNQDLLDELVEIGGWLARRLRLTDPQLAKQISQQIKLFRDEKFLEIVGEGITERLWATWQYLNHLYKPGEARENQNLLDELVEIGEWLARRLRLTDPQLAEQISQKIKMFQGEAGYE